MLHTDRIAELLLNIGALRIPENSTTVAAGMKLPLHCDTNLIYSNEAARTEVVDAFLSLIRTLHIAPDVIAATATGAIGWATLIADRLQLPLVYVRQSVTPGSSQKQIEGNLKPGVHVLVIEDVVITAASAIRTAEELRKQAQAIVTDVLSIFTYQIEQSLEAAESAAVKLHSLTNLTTVTNTAVEQGTLSTLLKQSFNDFTHSPEHWKQ